MATEFYRKGKDFYEAKTNRYIGETEFGKGEGFTEVPEVKPKADGSLSDTLTVKTDNLDTIRTLSRRAGELAFKQSGGGQMGFDIAKEQGIDIFSPETVRAAAEIGTLGLKAEIKDIFQRTLDSIDKQSEARKEGADYLMELAKTPDLLSQASGNELEFVKTYGYAPQSLIMKVADYNKAHPEAERNIVIGLATKYWDAGIDVVNDTPEQARLKVEKNSKIYAEKDKSPQGASQNKTVPWSETMAKLGLVGLPQNIAQDILSSSTYPDWFKQSKETESKMSILAIDLQKQWDEARKPILEAQQSEGESQWEYDAKIWQWLASEDAQQYSDEEKAQQIKEQGRNPESFGLYGY